MNQTSTEAGDAGGTTPDPGRDGGETADTPPQGGGMEGLGAADSLSAADYCHLAEECFFLAAAAKDPEAAAKLVKTGDDYLRCAAEWFAGQMRGA